MEANVTRASSPLASASILVARVGIKGNLPTHHHQPSARNPRDNVLCKWRLKTCTVGIGHFTRSLQCVAFNSRRKEKCCKTVWGTDDSLQSGTPLQTSQRIKRILFWDVASSLSFGNLMGLHAKIQHFICLQEELKHYISIIFNRFFVSAMLIISLSVTISKAPALALTEENLLFLEAWRTVDRAYVDKSFNGQSWFRYRENALRNEPMNTREETYRAIKNMLSTLDDPFTRFLEPEKFKSLQSGTQGALTGVGLSIGYPLTLGGSPSGLVVVSSVPGGPADKVGIHPGDVILAIDDENTEDMDVYDAADRLQGTEGSSVKLVVRSGTETKDLVLRREKVSINPVKSRLCEISRIGTDKSMVGYIKLTTFNQNASGAVKDAIETLRRKGVKSFVLDLRNNSGGLFPEGIEIAKIWLDKGVIVYICDSRGVRDIYEADGGSTFAASEPLAVLVNKGTASASEILAGALKDNKRAVLFGEPTFGKGKIQSVFKLSDGSGLAVTVARYETPAHTNIDKVGIMPDHPLPTPFPSNEDEFCSCLKDPSSLCNLDTAQLFSR